MWGGVSRGPNLPRDVPHRLHQLLAVIRCRARAEHKREGVRSREFRVHAELCVHAGWVQGEDMQKTEIGSRWVGREPAAVSGNTPLFAWLGSVMIVKTMPSWQMYVLPAAEGGR